MDVFWYQKGNVQRIHHTHLKNNLHKIFKEHDKVWIDMPSFGKDEEELLRVFFNIHPLTIEACEKAGGRPKLEEHDTYVYIVLYGLDANGHFVQLNYIIGEDYLITIQKHTMASYELLKHDEKKLSDLLAKDTEFVMHNLIDAEVDKYYPILEKFDDQIEKMEARVMHDTNSAFVREVFNVRHQIIILKHHLGPQKEVLFQLSHKGIKYMMNSSTDYFRDVYDHAARALDEIENYREILNGILDVHLSVTSNHLNDIIKVLTVFSTIFMPLTLIASIYGMNFVHMPELQWKYGYLLVLVVMVIIGLWMYVFFRKKKWV
jgi:magnesium transporter